MNGKEFRQKTVESHEKHGGKLRSFLWFFVGAFFTGYMIRNFGMSDVDIIKWLVAYVMTEGGLTGFLTTILAIASSGLTLYLKWKKK